jgi:hypothetical protein
MTKARSKVRMGAAVLLATLMLIATSVVVPGSIANPSPPTNGGNGAGHSGQCTGAASERPTSCQSP